MPPVIPLKRAPLREVEAVGRRPQPNHGLSFAEVGVDLAHLLVGQRAKPRGDHHQIGIAQGLEAGDVCAIVGVDFTGRRVDRVDHAAVEAVMGGEDLRQLRKGLLAAVLLVAAHEHDVLTLPRAVAPRDVEPRIASPSRRGQHQKSKHHRRNDATHHGLSSKQQRWRRPTGPNHTSAEKHPTQARMPLTTWPWTSVSRKSRPW